MKNLMNRKKTAALLTLLVAGGIAFAQDANRSGAPRGAGPLAPGVKALSNLDRRVVPGANSVGDVRRADAEKVLHSRLPHVAVARDEVTGSPKWIHAGDGFLSGKNGEGRAVSKAARTAIRADDPHAAVKAFVNEHAALFGHDARVLDAAPVRRDFTGRHNGLRTVTWQQEHEGISVFDATLTSHTTRDGELVSVGSQLLPDLAGAAAQGKGAQAAKVISAARAITLAAAEVGDLLTEAAIQEASPAVGAERGQKFRAAATKDEVDARLVWLPLDGSSMRLCWQVYWQSPAQRALYRVMVDAATGEVWVRHCLTADISNATYRVFTNDSPTPMLPGYAAPGNTNQPATVARSLVTLPALDVTASPSGWINDGGNETLGNNVDAHLDLNEDNQPDLPRPQGSPNRVFDFPLNLAQAPSAYRSAAVVNLFYWCNWMHDKLYALGFDEAAGNFQTDNFGKGGASGDPVLADAQDGGATANMSTPLDGLPPRLQLGIFWDPAPDRDASLDATIILHEYTHGLSNRRVGNGSGITTFQTLGLGEGWSDFYAMTLLTTATGGGFPVGAYVMRDFGSKFAAAGDNYYFGTRRYPYSTNLLINPLTFRDIAQTSPYPGVPKSTAFNWVASEEHCVGEVWCAMLWEVRANLINKLGAAAGNQMTLQLVTDGMNLSPNNPTFTQARDGILQADQILTGGTNQMAIMLGFAKRGLGAEAVAPAANTTSGGLESFDLADTLKLLPNAQVDIYGYFGGPFNFTSTNFVLSNASPSSLTWKGSAPLPLQLSVTNGALAAGATQLVAVTLNAALAATLPSAVWNVQFSNEVSHLVRTRRFGFNALEPFLLGSFPYNPVWLKGPAGGPFPTAGLLTLKNRSANSAMPWAVAAPWPFTITPSSGSVATNASLDLTIGVGPDGSLLSIGKYTNSLHLTNLVTGEVLDYQLELTVANDGYATELHTYGGFDLPNKTITFIPNGGTGGYNYGICVENAAAFPTDPSGSTLLPNNGYSFQEKAEVILSGGKYVTVAGQATNHLWVWPEGQVTFTPTNFSYPDSLAKQHFGQIGVSAFLSDDYYDDESIAAGGSVGWKQLADRFVVTWRKLVSAGLNGHLTNNFQTELFFDGRIRITLLNIETGTWALSGVSGGGGIPADYMFTDFSSRPNCAALLPNLKLTITSPLTEGAGTVAGAGKVSLPSPVATNVIVTLTSSDTSELTVPATATILAGATNGFFNVTVVNDALLDGSQTATVTAAHLNYDPAFATVTVHDNESTALHITPPPPLLEGGAYGAGLVFTTVPVAADVTVSLGNIPAGTLGFVLNNPFITIFTGQTSAVFVVRGVDNQRLEGPTTNYITASVASWISATGTVQVLDNESTNLTVTSVIAVFEGDGLVTNAGQVRIAGTLATNLTVSLSSGSPSLIQPLGPVTILAGQTNTFFNINVAENAVVDPIFQEVLFTASAGAGFSNGTCLIYFLDNDGPPDPFNPNPPDLADNVSVNTDISWAAIDGNLLQNGNFETGTLAGWTSEDTGAGGFVVNNGTFDPESPDGALPPQAGSYSALSQQLGNGHHAIWQDVTIPTTATSAILSWWQRVRNHAAAFVPGQQEFRVELRSPTNNQVLETLYATLPGTTLLGNWILPSVSLAAYRGQTVRIAFAQDDQLGYLNVHLDNIALTAGSPSPTSFDVYFGTNTIPGAGDLLGSTTNTSWTLPKLLGGIDYYWRVCTKRGAQTNFGPIWLFSTTGLTSPSPLVSLNSTWKYWAAGTDLGTSWRSLAFNDTAWPSGAGILGFGGKQNTAIGSANGIVTYYFRRKFTVNLASQFATLTTRFLRDDGIIAYLNGTEIILDNISTRFGVDYLTQAATIISGSDETAVITNALDPALLVEGTNILAVEVHQKHPALGNSPDLYFDLALDGNRNLGNYAPVVLLTSPANPLLVHTPTNVTLTATVTDEDFSGGTVKFFANGILVGVDSTAPFSVTWTNPPPGDYVLTAVASDSGGLATTSASGHLVVAPVAAQILTLIPRGSVWRYRDTGEDLGTNWLSYRFDDSAWSSGPAQLGYGDGDEATVLNHGPNAQANFITTYFRRTFTNNYNLTGLTLSLLRDDGAVVYLNGTEAVRQNLPAGAITYLTQASTNVPVTDENNLYSTTLSPTLAKSGLNTIAAEIHESFANSVDLSFDLELTAVGNPLPAVALTSPTSGSAYVKPANISLAATASDVFGQVVSVQFFANGSSLGSVSNAPYQLTWTNPPGANYTLTAVATDNSGGTNTSYPSFINVASLVSLSAWQQDGQWQLSWPQDAGNFNVLASPSLGPDASWRPITNAVIATNGLFVVPISTVETQRFFRLHNF